VEDVQERGRVFKTCICVVVIRHAVTYPESIYVVKVDGVFEVLLTINIPCKLPYHWFLLSFKLMELLFLGAMALKGGEKLLAVLLLVSISRIPIVCNAGHGGSTQNGYE